MKPSALILSATLLIVSQAALADGECDKYTTSYDQTYCMAKIFVESDKDLNTIYKDLQAVIDADSKKSLTLVQRKWIKYRDNSCESKGTIDVDCNYKVNRDRAQYLTDRLRECRGGTCRKDMIGQESWK